MLYSKSNEFAFLLRNDSRQQRQVHWYKTVHIAFVYPVVIIPHVPVCQFTENSIQLVSNGGNFATVSDDPTDPARCFRIAITDDTDPALTKKFTISFVVDFAEPDGVNISTIPSEATVCIEGSSKYNVNSDQDN